VNLVLILFFDTPYKRTNADHADPAPPIAAAGEDGEKR